MKQTYDSSDIQVLEGLEAVRVRPGMYIGSTGTRGLHHLLWEIVDNSIDEAGNGYADAVRVTLHRDGSATVSDNGRGMPVDIHPQYKMSGVEVIFTKLHAGGKFNNEQYKYSGGLHGVGASVVNALSRYVEVSVSRGGSKYHIRFETKYNPKTQKTEAGIVAEPMKRVGPSKEHGTTVSFLPDRTIFEETAFRSEQVKRRLRDLAYLNKGLTVVFESEVEPSENETFKFDGGLVDLVADMNRDKSALHAEPIMFAAERDGLKAFDACPRFS